MITNTRIFFLKWSYYLIFKHKKNNHLHFSRGWRHVHFGGQSAFDKLMKYVLKKKIHEKYCKTIKHVFVCALTLCSHILTYSKTAKCVEKHLISWKINIWLRPDFRMNWYFQWQTSTTKFYFEVLFPWAAVSAAALHPSFGCNLRLYGLLYAKGHSTAQRPANTPLV